MNSSQFMDKQMMGLSGGAGAQQGSDPLDLLDPAEGLHSNGGTGKEYLLPSYDFQQIRRPGVPPPSFAGFHGGGGAAAWGSADSKPVLSGFNNYGSLEAHESSKVIYEKSRDTYDTASVAEIDLTVKKYADILLHAVEGVSSRLSQLEGRTHQLESAVDDLKLCINNSGSTDGKLRQLENILQEVQAGVQVIRDKQEIAGAQMQLAKLQVSKGDDQPQDNVNAVSSDSQQLPMPLSQQPLQWPAQPSAAPPLAPPLQIPSLPAPPAPNAPLPEPPQQNPPPVQFSSQVPQHLVSSFSSIMPPCEPHFPPPGQPPAEAPQQHYQPPPQQTQVPPPQSYQPAPQLAQYSQPPQPPDHIAPLHRQPSLPPHLEESSPCMPPPQAYPPSIHQPFQLQAGPSSPQQIYGSAPNIYDHPTSRPASGQQPFPAGYGPPSGPTFSESFPYSGSLSPYSSAREPSPFSSSPAPAPPSGSSYPRLPIAQILPKAPPTGSSSSGSTGSRVPIDDVVDRVTTMGFPIDLVRATVRKLTENGQSVDLNVVLDKLMNDGEGQPQKGWFGR